MKCPGAGAAANVRITLPGIATSVKPVAINACRTNSILTLFAKRPPPGRHSLRGDQCRRRDDGRMRLGVGWITPGDQPGKPSRVEGDPDPGDDAGVGCQRPGRDRRRIGQHLQVVHRDRGASQIAEDFPLGRIDQHVGRAPVSRQRGPVLPEHGRDDPLHSIVLGEVILQRFFEPLPAKGIDRQSPVTVEVVRCPLDPGDRTPPPPPPHRQDASRVAGTDDGASGAGTRSRCISRGSNLVSPPA